MWTVVLQIVGSLLSITDKLTSYFIKKEEVKHDKVQTATDALIDRDRTELRDGLDRVQRPPSV